MSRFPTPRNIRKAWKVGDLNLAQCAAEVSTRISIDGTSYGPAVEARCWVMARGWPKGMLKRVDVAYEREGAFASVRFSGGMYTLRLGREAAR